MQTSRSRMIVLLTAVAALMGVSAPALAQSQCPDWIPTFGEQPGMIDPVRALIVFDDGTGPALYAGGEFTSAGAIGANHIAKWDGTSWSPVGDGIDGIVRALIVFDDGAGPALYAGGNFTSADGVAASRIAKWDGTSWSALGSGLDSSVNALTVFDNGTGPALYAGGWFNTAGGVAASLIARWDGVAWSALGSGVTHDSSIPIVYTLGVFDDGTGAALYAGGQINTAGGISVNNIALWDGTSWSALGSGLEGGVPFALAVFDDGTGPALYAGGGFTTAGAIEAELIAKWDGTAWSALPSGSASGQVYELTVVDDGTGSALYASGSFSIGPRRIAKWDGNAWSGFGLGTGTHAVFALADFDDGTGPALYAAGDFETVGAIGANSIARWDGATWSSLGRGITGIVGALTVFDDGTGAALYVGGEFDGADGIEAKRVAKWDGVEWSSLGNGLGDNFADSVSAFAVFDDGAGPSLYAGGRFRIFNTDLDYIARWDDVAWSDVGGGLIHHVNALIVFDDGTGLALYAGGLFHEAVGVSPNHIAKWDGTSWSPLGSGVGPSFSERVNTLTVFDDGTGPALYAGGRFLSAGGNPANRIAKWNGATWSPLGSGLEASNLGGPIEVLALTVFDDGTGPALYAGGHFNSAGGLAANCIAKWDGASWSALGSGVAGGSFIGPTVHALTAFDDGTGPALVVGGIFTAAGSVAANHIAKWGGAEWSALGSGVDGLVNISPTEDGVFALTVFDDGTGPNLIVGGSFAVSPAADSFLARWGGADGPVCPGDANGDGVIDFGDITSVIGNWLSDGAAGGDANCNSSVDFKDITTILANWLVPCP